MNISFTREEVVRIIKDHITKTYNISNEDILSVYEANSDGMEAAIRSNLIKRKDSFMGFTQEEYNEEAKKMRAEREEMESKAKETDWEEAKLYK